MTGSSREIQINWLFTSVKRIYTVDGRNEIEIKLNMVVEASENIIDEWYESLKNKELNHDG